MAAIAGNTEHRAPILDCALRAAGFAALPALAACSERITGVVFVLMVAGWIFADALRLNVTSIALAGLGLLLLANVLTVDDIALQATRSSPSSGWRCCSR
jgi:hypothetical protein